MTTSSATKTAKSWMSTFLTQEDKRNTRFDDLQVIILAASHDDGSKGTLDNVPKSVMTDLREAAQAHYLATHGKMTVAVVTEGDGDAKTRKAWVVGKGNQEVTLPEGSKGTLETFAFDTAAVLTADLKDTPPSKKAAMVRLRAVVSNYCGINADRAIAGVRRRFGDKAKVEAESLGETDGAGSSKKTRDFKTFAIESLSALHKRASKGRGKDATVPDGWDAKIAAANAAWHKAVFGS